MDVSPALQQLVRPGHIVVHSDHELAERVRLEAKKLATKRPSYGPSKTLKPIADMHGALIRLTPLEVLHEVGRATVFQERAAIRDIQRMWSQLRYCDAFGYGAQPYGRDQRLLHMSTDALAKRFHHANVQSESLGIGFAIILARRILTQQNPGWTWIPIDAEMVLDAGFDIPEGRLRPYSRQDTKLRPDYFLLGHKPDGLLSRTKLVVLECKGTHYDNKVSAQLGKAAYQLESVQLGGTTPPGYMVSTLLRHDCIIAHILDPDGEDELWQGDPGELDQEPEQLDLPRTPPEAAAESDEPQPEQLTLFPDPNAASSTPSAATPTPTATRTATQVFLIPAENKTWFARVLSRTSAAAALLFSGDQTRARNLISERQRQRSFGGHTPDIGDVEHRDTGVGTVRGTAHTFRWPGGRRMEIFNGVDTRVFDALNTRGAGGYVAQAQAGTQAIDGAGDEVFIRADDGTVTGFRLLAPPRRRRRI
jgi:hypothetical protein